MHIYSCQEQKKQFNVIKSLACQMRADHNRMRILQKFKKQQNIDDNQSKIIYNIFDDPLTLDRLKLQKLHYSKVSNPFQVIIDKNRSKKKRNYCRMMTLMNDNQSDRFKSQISNQTSSLINQISAKQHQLKQEYLKKDYNFDQYTCANSQINNNQHRKLSDLSENNNKIKYKHFRVKSLPSSFSNPQNTQCNKKYTNFKQAQINFLNKKGILSEIQSKKSLNELLGKDYYQQILRDRYKQDYKTPSILYTIIQNNSKPSPFIKNLQKLRSDIVRRQKLVIKGKNRNKSALQNILRK